MSTAVAIVVAIAAVAIGLTMLSHHKERLGVIFMVGAVVAVILAFLARPR